VVVGEHAVGLQHVGKVAGHLVDGHHGVDLLAQARQRQAQAFQLGLGVLGDQTTDAHLRLMQDGGADADARRQAEAFQAQRQQGDAVGRQQFLARHHLGGGKQLGEDHGDGLQGLHLDVGIAAFLAVLHDQDADHARAADDRHAHEGVVQLLARFRAVGEGGMGPGVGQRHGAAMGGDLADQALAHPQAGLVDGGLAQAVGGEQLQHLAGAHDVAGADLGLQGVGDGAHDLVEPLLSGPATGHDVAQPRQEAACDIGIAIALLHPLVPSPRTGRGPVQFLPQIIR